LTILENLYKDHKDYLNLKTKITFLLGKIHKDGLNDEVKAREYFE